MVGKYGGRRLSADRAPNVRKQGMNRKWNGSMKGLGLPTMLQFLQQGSASFTDLSPTVPPAGGHVFSPVSLGSGDISHLKDNNLTHSYCSTNGGDNGDINTENPEVHFTYPFQLKE